MGHAWVLNGSRPGTEWVTPGYGMGHTWVRNGSRLGTEWARPRYGMGHAWVWNGSRLEMEWVMPGLGMGHLLVTDDVFSWKLRKILQNCLIAATTLVLLRINTEREMSALAY